MSKTTMVYFATDSAFEEDNSKKRGALKKRALQALSAKLQEVVAETTNPSIANACFRILRQEGGKSWKLCLDRRNK